MASGYQQIYIAGEAWISMQDYSHASAQSIPHMGSSQRPHDAEKLLLQVHRRTLIPYCQSCQLAMVNRRMR